MTSCIFCNIIKSNHKNIIYQNSELIVLPDIKPKAPVHLLIIPKKHIINLKDINHENNNLLYNVFLVINKICKLIEINNDFKIVVNNGKNAGQEVFHLHFHFLSFNNK